MHKCPNCGQEFDGKFCPYCGEQWQEEKICPNCGTKLDGSARFCNECGYSLYNSVVNETAITAVKTQTITLSKQEILSKVYTALKYAPTILFLLFSVLLFAFYSAPVAVMPAQEIFGEIIPAESYGNVYSMYSGILGEVPELKSAMIALIVFAVFTLMNAIFLLAIKFLPSFKNRKTNRLITLSSFIFYFVFFIIGCVICGKIAELDDGMEILDAGSCPVLLIIFSLIFIIVDMGAYIGHYLINKKNPVIVKHDEEKIKIHIYKNEQLKKQRREKFIATHPEPVAPKEVLPVRNPKINKILIDEAVKIPDYQKMASKLHGYNLVVLHFALAPFLGITFLYILFCIPIGYRKLNFYDLATDKVLKIKSLVFSIILSVISMIIPTIIAASTRYFLMYFMCVGLFFILYGLISLILGLVGIKNKNKLSILVYGVKNPQKCMPTTEYGKMYIEFTEQYKKYKNYKKTFAIYKVKRKIYLLRLRRYN